MRLVFMGTPEAALPTLRRCLEDGHEIVGVWTQPDKPAGRGKKLAESPVKSFALRHNLTLYQPAKIKIEESKALFASHAADVAVVVAYGRILPKEYLTAPRFGCVNVHFSLLPRYRGAAPVNWAIMNGEETTGVTTMFIEEELDSGPILLQSETGIAARETAPELMTRLSELGAEALSQTLKRFNEISPTIQNHSEATFAPMLQKQNGVINWADSAIAIERRIRGLQPWPNAFTEFASRRLIIWDGETVTGSNSDASPGEVLLTHADNLVVQCGEKTALRLTAVQPEGARRMSARDFLNGSHIHVGDHLGPSE
jgi:methionyl-tRNA formyltransferase